MAIFPVRSGFCFSAVPDLVTRSFGRRRPGSRPRSTRPQHATAAHEYPAEHSVESTHFVAVAQLTSSG
jgi:hypothetical protein